MPPADPSNLIQFGVTQRRAAQLRTLLRQKYPEAHRPPPTREATPAGPSAELSATEALTFTSLQGVFTEILGEEAQGACPGIGLILHHLLEQAQVASRGVVLVDGADRFDPQSYPAPLCRNLFWARCRNIETALKVTDLFLRDGNLPLVILDLFHHPERELARIHLSIWYRLRQLTEQSGCGLCLLTAHSTSSAAHRRLALTSCFTLDSQDLPRTALLPALRLRQERAQSRRASLPSLPPSESSRRIA